MKERVGLIKFFDQMARCFMVALLIIAITGAWGGEKAQWASTILGARGLSYVGIFQVAILSFIMTSMQHVFLTECWIKKMSYAKRMILFMSTIFIAITILVAWWGWFPIDSGLAWIGFIVSYIVSLLISMFIFSVIFKSREKEYERLLTAYQKKQEVERNGH